MNQEGIITLLAVVSIVSGLVYFSGAALGLVRFPDFYTRMHAAGKGDTLSSLLLILGFGIYQFRDFDFTFGNIAEDYTTLLLFLKLLGICAFVMMTSPTSTHALMDAGWEEGIPPELGDAEGNDLEKDTRNSR